MFIPSPETEQELNQTLRELHQLVRDELFPEIKVPGSIEYDSQLGRRELPAAVFAGVGTVETANVQFYCANGRFGNYAIHIGPGAVMLGARAMVERVAHELSHVARYAALFDSHPRTPGLLLRFWHKLRRQVINEEHKVDELCQARGLERFLNERWPTQTI